MLEFEVERMRMQSCSNCKAEFEGIVCNTCGRGLEIQVNTGDLLAGDVEDTMADIQSSLEKLQDFRAKATQFFEIIRA
jgi:hypothetical protein